MPALQPKTVVLLGVPFHDVTMEETLGEIDRLIAERTPRYLATANLDFAAQASRDVELQRILLEADLVLCDGTPLVWTSRWLKAPLRERVAGSDLTPKLAQHAAKKGYRLFFLGSNETVLNTARERMEAEYPGLQVCGVYAPPYARLLDLDHEEITARIHAARPDILLVALGAPKQEKWIYMHYRELGVPCSIGIGASLDFVAGKFSRAPVWMQRSGLEWVFRLSQEPRRLLSRYADDFFFFGRALAAQLWQVRERAAAKLEVQIAPPAAASGPVGSHVGFVWVGRVDAASVAEGAIAEPAPAEGSSCVVLDLSQVTFMDSTGVGFLVKAFKRCREQGSVLVLLNPSSIVQALLQTLKLARLFPTASTVEEACHVAGRSRSGSQPECQQLSSLGRMAVRCRGELSAATARQLFGQVEEEWSASSSKSMELDLRDLEFIDSSGLACLLRLRQMVRDRGDGTLVIEGASENVRNVLALAHLAEPMEVQSRAA